MGKAKKKGGNATAAPAGKQVNEADVAAIAAKMEALSMNENTVAEAIRASPPRRYPRGARNCCDTDR